MSFDTRIDRLKRRLNRQEEPFFLTIQGDPEVRRLQHFGLLQGVGPRGDDRPRLLCRRPRRDD
jgi:hypothetical protein